jgi:hypothetical protein
VNHQFRFGAIFDVFPDAFAAQYKGRGGAYERGGKAGHSGYSTG